VLVRLHPRQRILPLLTAGYVGLATDVGGPWLELVAIGFGIGMALTMDEFALAVVCFQRARRLTGLFGLFVPLVAFVGAVSPPRPQARSTA
jgi:hypothetical protein